MIERTSHVAAGSSLAPISLTRSMLAVAAVSIALLPSHAFALASPQAAPAASTEVHAHGDIAGNWQGTLQAGKPLRLVLTIAKADKGWTARMYSIDQGGQGFNASGVTLDGSAFKYTLDVMNATYTGTLSADGNSIAGTWTQGPTTLPLTLVRATKDTAWEIPAPPPPVKLMAADANPSFDVATIKPNNTGATSMQGLTVNGRNFRTRASSLADLIGFAYQVQMKQIVGAPDWIDKDRYDIDAVPDVEGAPNPAQVRLMIQKLLTDRFKLTFHHDKKDLSAFVLTAPKPTDKLKPTELSGLLPGIGFGPAKGGLSLFVRNAMLTDFTGFLQTLVLDRPVVDRTGLTGKYDFTVTFSPDDSQFNGHPPIPPKADGVEAAPGLFDALQQQLGLKLEAQKTPVEVLAIDHVEKPSAN